jgi:flagellar L-ring protein FlgH
MIRPLLPLLLFALGFALCLPAGILPKRKKEPKLTALEEYLEAVRTQEGDAAAGRATPGSAYTSSSRLSELVRDFRASQAGDLITIVVSDRANAVSSAGSTADRQAEAGGGVRSILGTPPAAVAGRLGDLVNMRGNSSVQGQGETSRSSTLSTTLAARIVEVLPNGNLVVEGRKAVTVNSERQLVEVRGVVRWNDVNSLNQVRSDRIAQMELNINGRGIVGDAVRRPNLLYRVLLGVLPF